MKKMIVGFIAGLIMATSISVYAEDGLEKVESYLRAGLKITLDGEPVKLDNPPVMYDGSTHLQLRDVAKLFGAGVNWNEATQTVELTSTDAAPIESKTSTGSDIKVPDTQISIQTQILELKGQISGAQQGIDNLNYFVKLVELDIEKDPNNQNHKTKLQNYLNRIAEFEEIKAGFELDLGKLESQPGTP